MNQEIRLPAFLAILLLILGLGSTVILVEKGPQLLSQATSDSRPQLVTQVNITDTSVSVGWLTQKTTVGAVKYQKHSSLASANTAFDVRDMQNKPASRYTHFVTIPDLTPQTKYRLTIVADNKPYADQSMIITTGPALPPPPAPGPPPAPRPAPRSRHRSPRAGPSRPRRC